MVARIFRLPGHLLFLLSTFLVLTVVMQVPGLTGCLLLLLIIFLKLCSFQMIPAQTRP